MRRHPCKQGSISGQHACQAVKVLHTAECQDLGMVLYPCQCLPPNSLDGRWRGKAKRAEYRAGHADGDPACFGMARFFSLNVVEARRIGCGSYLFPVPGGGRAAPFTNVSIRLSSPYYGKAIRCGRPA